MSSGPPRDASYSALQTKNGVAERFSAGEFQAGRLNVSELYVQGIPVEQYIHQLVSHYSTTSVHLTAPENVSRELKSIVSDSSDSDFLSVPSVTRTTINSTANNVDFAQVSARSAHAHVADVSHAYHDPVNGKPGYVLTSDEAGQGSWQPLPRSGDVEGPLRSKPDSVAVFDATNGRLLRDCNVFIQNDVLNAVQIKVKQLVVEDVNNTGPGSVATKNIQGNLEWKDTANLPVIRQLLDQVKAVQQQLQQWVDSHETLAQKHVQHEQQVQRQLVTLVQSTDVTKPWDVDNVAVPLNTPHTAFLMTTDQPGKITWQPSDRFARWKVDSGDLPGSIPVQIDGQLVSTDILVNDRRTLLCDALKTANLIADEANLLLAIAKDITCKNIISDDISAQRLSALELTLPQDAKSGMVLTAANDDGKCQWAAHGSIKPPPEPVVPKSIATFADDTGSALDSSCIMVNGTVLCSADTTILEWNLQTNQIKVGGDAKRIAIGSQALNTASPDISSLVAIGAQTLQNAQVSELVAIGDRSQAAVKTGHGNTSVGIQSLEQNQEGHENTAVGHQALREAKSNANTAIGSGSLISLTDGGHNTAVGAGSGEMIATGKSNVCIGDGAGPVGDFSSCICIGQNAHALMNGDLALGSTEAPLKLIDHATSGRLPGLNPTCYLSATINGQPFRLALFDP